MSKIPYLADSDNLVVLLTLVGLNDIPSYLADVPRGTFQNYGNDATRPTNAMEKF